MVWTEKDSNRALIAALSLYFMGLIMALISFGFDLVVGMLIYGAFAVIFGVMAGWSASVAKKERKLK